jgi:hypothetical protein
MKRLMALGIVAAAAAVAATTVAGAPYEDQKIQIQRLQQEKLGGKSAGMGGDQQNPQHMQLMREMSRQMQQARGVDQMTPEQMRAWITEHTRLMDRMHQAMMQDDPMRGMRGSMMGRPGRSN